MRVRVAAMVRRDNALLVLEYLYDEGTVFAIPGGGVDGNESVTEAIRREYREELKVEVTVGPLLYVGEAPPRGKLPRTLHLVFAGDIGASKPEIDPEHTSALCMRWLPFEELDQAGLYPDLCAEILADWQGCDEGTARYVSNCLKREWR